MSKEREKPKNAVVGETGTEASLVPVALYVRAACFTQAILDEQREALERYAAQNNMRVVRRYVEGGLPGAMRDNLLRTVMTGEADFTVIVMRDISRWGRGDLDVTVYYEYLCLRAGIGVRYVQEEQTAGRDSLSYAPSASAFQEVFRVFK